MNFKLIYDKDRSKYFLVINLLIIVLYFSPFLVGIAKVPEDIWIYSWIGIAIFILVILIADTFAIINMRLFKLINKNQQRILTELVKSRTSMSKYELVKKLKGMPQATGYRHIDTLINAKLILKDKNNKLQLNTGFKDSA